MKKARILYVLCSQWAATVLLLELKLNKLRHFPAPISSKAPYFSQCKSPHNDQSGCQTARSQPTQHHSTVTNLNFTPVFIHSVLAMLAFLLFLEYSKHTSGPLLCLFPLLRKLFPQISLYLTLHLLQLFAQSHLNVPLLTTIFKTAIAMSSLAL